MSYAISYTERLKVQDKDDCLYTLYDMCNWIDLEKPAIEYYNLQEIKIINYNELQAATQAVSNCLKCIQFPEFIGINFDILEYCVPSLMLGILDNGSAFFNVPSDMQTCQDILIALHVRYIFSKYVISNREVVCQLNIHGQSVYLTKLIHVPENIIGNRKWQQFAYAIATSGSTGLPKIVKIPHSCIVPNIIDLKRILDMTECDKIAQLTNFTFDPCIVEIFLSLSCAATLFMVSKQLKNEVNRLLEKIYHAHVTVLQITPSLLFHKWSTECLKTTIFDKDSYLRVLLLGGEPFPNTKLLSKASHPQNKTRLFNIYGITEVSCWSSVNEVIRNSDIDESCIGEPLSGTMFQLKNEDNEIVTRGSGFLYIGSSSRICIIGDEIEDNLSKPVFRDTGDIISIDDHGRMFYKGRRNNVVKRFGNKINLRELEKVVTELNFVRNCAVLWDTESHKLYLCLSTAKTKEFINLKNDIISHLRILPAIYKPDKIIIVEQFDFTTSGKICLSSLRKVCKDSETEVTSANNLHADVGEIFQNLWNQHIKSKNVGFLTSGGTSITALQISSAVVEMFKMEFPELIGMLLKDVTFTKCVNYIRTTLANRDWNENFNRYIGVSYDDKIQNTFNTEKVMIEKSVLNNFPILTNRNNSYQYKCRGRIDGDVSIQEQNIKLLSANISSIEVVATYNLQKCIDASPTVYCYSASELFATVGSHSGIICTINLLEINSKPYEFKLPDRIEASVLVLADFHGIVGCYDGYIYCIHLKTGKVIWKFQTQDMVKCTAITCIQKSKIFVGSYDHHVYCLSVKDGTQIWKNKVSQGGICATGCLHLQSASILFGTLDSTCLALRQFSGQVTWKRKLQNPIFVAPTVLQTGHVLFCSVAGTLYCFDIETDCQMWRYEICGNLFSYPVSTRVSTSNAEHVVLASHNKHLYCLEMPQAIMKEKEPKLKYALQFHSSIFATPWCQDEYMFVACTDGTFQVFDLLNGKLLATKQLPGETFSSPVVHNDLAVLGCRDNNLYVLKLS
ncbi:beta-alanine-activating enzyme [Odontomachus brunneus]|uniref:beta-alanine-activating enzyme n=1 Tax=Odontomachus brunneus TaxID=486640 RepID=UPI0013F25324|nr:beta-alanine-activating enzyme [Odontomachus brunneus]